MTQTANNYGYLAETIKLIEKNYPHSLNLSSLAQAAGVSESKLQHDFTAVYGVSLKRYQTEIRVNAAKQFLTQTKNSIKYISEKVGYKSTPSFAHAFKKSTGKRPSEYRNAENS